MDKDIIVLKKYGVYPKQEFREEIRNLLINEINTHDYRESHEYLRVLCFLLFSIGKVEDCELIYKAKTLNMDAGCMIDCVYLCGAGYDETLEYVKKKGLHDIKKFIVHVEKEFNKEEIINNCKSYYGLD